MHEDELPAVSVALYVRVIVYLLAQICPEITSFTKLTVGVPQLSDLLTELGSGAGTSEAHETVNV